MLKTNLENQMSLRDLGEIHGEFLVILSVFITGFLVCYHFTLSIILRDHSQLCHWFLQVAHILWLLDTVPEWGDVGTVQQKVWQHSVPSFQPPPHSPPFSLLFYHFDTLPSTINISPLFCPRSNASHSLLWPQILIKPFFPLRQWLLSKRSFGKFNFF